MSSRRARAGASSSRPLAAVIMLLLAAVSLTLGPAFTASSAPAPSDRFGSAPFSASFSGASSGAGASQPGHIRADGREVTPPTPWRAGLRHSSAGATALERPAFDAILPAAVVAGSLLVLLVAAGGSARRRGVALRRGSARAPPASLA